MAKANWEHYEDHIYKKLKEWAGSQAEVVFNKKLVGRFSGVKRQVDALITGRFAGEVEKDITAAVDCKHYSRKVNVKHVEMFMGLKEDVDTDLGLLITNVGFSKAAKNRAIGGIKLHVIPDIIVSLIDDLPSITYPVEWGEDYYVGDFWEDEHAGTFGAMVLYNYVEPESPFPIDHPDQLEWLDDLVTTGQLDAVNWSDADGRKSTGKSVLEHYLSRTPTDDEIELFVAEIASSWEDGQTWSVEVDDIRQKTGLDPNIT